MNVVPLEQLVTALTRNLVLEIAPYETMLFHTQGEAYFSNPDEVLRNLMGDVSGRGVIFLVPIVRNILKEVVDFVAAEVRGSTNTECPISLQSAVRKAFTYFRLDGYPQDEDVLSPLTWQQRWQIRQLALEKAQQYELPKHKAQLLAEMVVQSLAVSG